MRLWILFQVSYIRPVNCRGHHSRPYRPTSPFLVSSSFIQLSLTKRPLKSFLFYREDYRTGPFDTSRTNTYIYFISKTVERCTCKNSLGFLFYFMLEGMVLELTQIVFRYGHLFLIIFPLCFRINIILIFLY